MAGLHKWLFALADMLIVLVAILAAAVIALAAVANPPAATTPDIPPPGNIAVLACWPEGPIDVDVWALSPGDLPVGYSHKSGKVWSLLRDDMGVVNDTSEVNCESMFARATPAGEYALNIHGYSLPMGPVSVHVEVALNGRLLVSRDMDLKPKQERTVVRFVLDDAGGVVSHNEVFKGLRSAKK